MVLTWNSLDAEDEVGAGTADREGPPLPSPNLILRKDANIEPGDYSHRTTVLTSVSLTGAKHLTKYTDLDLALAREDFVLVIW